MIVHGGYGLAQGYAFDQIAATCEQVDAAGGDDLDLITALAQGIFSERFFADLQHRQAMWRLMLGGVFDRHPALKLMMAEVRADWLPDTLAHLDAVYDEHRGDLPSRRKPSEWWESNCIAGVSFMHKAEVEIRDDIGVDHMTFGATTRTPRARGRTPSSPPRPVRGRARGRRPEDPRREHHRGFGLDPDSIAAIAQRVGVFSAEQLTGDSPDIDPLLIAHLRRAQRVPQTGRTTGHDSARSTSSSAATWRDTR